MNKPEKIMFIMDLIKNVQNDILAKVGNIPEDWVGLELRQYISDKFKDATIPNLQQYHKERLRKYRNTLKTTNL